MPDVAVPRFTVVPDRLDIRDRLYQPSVSIPPKAEMSPRFNLQVLNQGGTNACTGFALATLIHHLFRARNASGEGAPPLDVSPFMLYSMARRYDEFPGATEDTGSSLRGAMKGWYHHGACQADLWPAMGMPTQPVSPQSDWWLDAALRPLGAYYRVDTRSVTDMHVALAETGALYASALCHHGWMEKVTEGGKGLLWTIPSDTSRRSIGGHAFTIVGYNSRGFIVQNSWGPEWGSAGLGVLTYDDWLDNAMDCWVAQLGVVTDLHQTVAASSTIRVVGDKVQLASERTLRDRELSPFIIDMEKDGKLSTSGAFRTQKADVRSLVTLHMDEARKRWGLGPDEPMDVAIYAHGGLVGEEGASDTASRWIPALYNAQVFPIFLMWESDLKSTLEYMVQERLQRKVPVGGLRDWVNSFWNERVEGLVSRPGSALWDEMKENAKAITYGKDSGGHILYECANETEWFQKKRVRLHLIGHSAGSIVHCHLIDALSRLDWTFETVNFMAAAATVNLFRYTVVPRIADGTVKRLNAFHLTDAVEQQDSTCRPVLGYSRSLLYLVSRSLEHGVPTPLVGLEKDFHAMMASLKEEGLPLESVKDWSAPDGISKASTHGAFDDDALTIRSVVSLLK